MGQLRLAMDDSSRVGEARRLAVRLAGEVGLSEVEVGRLALVVTELGTNLVRHARKGEMLLSVMYNGDAPAGIEVLSVDGGPGSDDGGLAWMRDGYSTGGTSGTGLGAVRRQSDEFDLYTQAGRGTTAVARVRASGVSVSAPPKGEARFQLGAVCLPTATESRCGDGWAYAKQAGLVSLMVVDGLGHGPEAAEVADKAVQTFQQRPFDPPVSVVEAIHSALSGTRGGAVAVAQLTSAQVRYAGVGNIAGTLLGQGPSRGLMSHHGTAGVAMRHLQEIALPMSGPSLLVMHSDGLASRWRPDAYPGLWERHASLCASTLYRDFRRERDDITVLVVRSAP